MISGRISYVKNTWQYFKEVPNIFKEDKTRVLSCNSGQKVTGLDLGYFKLKKEEKIVFLVTSHSLELSLERCSCRFICLL